MGLTFLYKYLHSALEVGFSDCTNPSLRSSRQGMNLNASLVPTETFKGSYFKANVCLWNTLPLDLRN